MIRRSILFVCILMQIGLTEATVISKEINTKEDPPKKELWAKSIMGQKAPKLVVDKWVNYKPKDTEGKFILYHYWNPSYAWGAYLAIPRFNRLHKELAKNLYIIGITDAAPEYVDDIIPVIKYPYASAPKMIDIMEITEFCHVVLTTPDGVVIWEGCPYLKGQNLTDKELKKLIRTYKRRR